MNYESGESYYEQVNSESDLITDLEYEISGNANGFYYFATTIENK